MDHRGGWNAEAFRERYSEVLERYDYIVGDWGYNQLRLKGLYKDNNPKATKDTSYSTLSDYINEYCNFGCAYFVLHKTKEIKDPKELKELKEAQEAMEEAEAREARDERETGDGKGEHKSKEHFASKQEQKRSETETAETRGKREPREGKESKDRKERPGKPHKGWRESKNRGRDNREHRSSKGKPQSDK